LDAAAMWSSHAPALMSSTQTPIRTPAVSINPEKGLRFLNVIPSDQESSARNTNKSASGYPARSNNVGAGRPEPALASPPAAAARRTRWMK